MVLQSHYRTQSKFSWEILEAAQSRLLSWQAVVDLRFQIGEPDAQQSQDKELNRLLEDIQRKAIKQLQDDLNSPEALVTIEAGIELIQATDNRSQEVIENYFKFVNDIIGIDLLDTQDIDNALKQKIQDRQTARDNKDWATSDKIRNELAEQGLSLQDKPDHQIWSRTNLS